MKPSRNHALRFVGQPGLLVLSFNRRDSLARIFATMGWSVDAMRTISEAERHLASAAPKIVFVDRSGASGQALRAVKRLAPLAKSRGHRLVAVYRQGGSEAEALARAGIDHILKYPCYQNELNATLTIVSEAIRRQRTACSAGPPEHNAQTPALDAAFPDAAVLRHWIEARVGKRATALLIISLSRFERINQAFGAERAEFLLRIIGRRIQALAAEAGAESFVARMAGPEYAVGLAGPVSQERVMLLADAILDRVSQPVAGAERGARIGCHIGVAVAEAGIAARHELIGQAADALNRARANGAGLRIALYNAEEAAASVHVMRLASDLRAAIARDEIEIFFQPQWQAGSGRITGVEALARWRHPSHGLIGAETLFAVAEQSDYLLALSAHVQSRALFAMAHWPASLAHLRMAINVTAQDLAQPGFANRFVMLATKAGALPSRLTIEVTESGLMQDRQAIAQTLVALRRAGCAIAIDDFGTGYSSLAHLKDLPADFVKLDKGLCADITGSARDRVIVTGTIDMARSLGLGVIVEGVESETQLALLEALGCGLFQGFLRAGALSAAALQALVESAD